MVPLGDEAHSHAGLNNMNNPSVVKSFRALRKLKIRVKIADGVQVTKAGSHYRARFRGRANSVFGSTAQEARERLLNSPSAKDSQRNSSMRNRNWAEGFKESKA